MNKPLQLLFIRPALRLSISLLSLIIIACVESDTIVPEDGSDDAAIRASADERVSAAGKSMMRTFTARLTGDQEFPGVETDGSGRAILKLSKDGTLLSYKIIVTNLENVTQAHIHCGEPDSNGPVVAFLFGFNAEGVTMNGVLAEGTITEEDVIARPDTEECMGGVASFSQLIEKLRSGGAYVNVHTLEYPGGEIRGQVR